MKLRKISKKRARSILKSVLGVPKCKVDIYRDFKAPLHWVMKVRTHPGYMSFGRTIASLLINHEALKPFVVDDRYTTAT